MRRKFYASLRSRHDYMRVLERCDCGGNIFECGKFTPAPYIAVPPYKRPPKSWQHDRWQRLSLKCDSCFLDEIYDFNPRTGEYDIVTQAKP